MRKIISLLVVPVLVLCSLLVSVESATAATIQLCNTSGETAQQCLAEIQNINSNLSGNYALNMDVILPVTPLTTFTPVGSDATPFTGTFAGQGHVIANLHILDSGADTGFFGVVTGSVHDLTLFNVEATNATGNIGALVGTSKGGAIAGITLKNITITSTGGENVGSLVGLNDTGTITNCNAVSAISVSAVNNNDVGGLVGQNTKTLSPTATMGIFNSSANATVSGAADVGGLLGGSYSSGLMSVEQSYSAGTVTGNSTVFGGTGGLVGSNDDNQEIVNCYSRAKVTGNNRVGGLVGLNDGDITNTYSTGLVTGSTNVGGLVGVNNGQVKQYSYWDTETSGQATSAGGTYAVGKTTAEMKQQSTYSGWDFTTIWHIFSGDYPVLGAHTKEVTLSGIAYLDQGSMPVPVGTIVKLYVNGSQTVLNQATLTTAGGVFSFDVDSDELVSGQTLLLYMVDPTHEGNAIFVPNNNTSDITGINILANRVYVYSSTPITSATFTTAKGTLTNDVLFDICSCGQVDFNVPQLDLDSTDNVNIGGLIGSATDRMAIAKLIYLKNLPIPSGKLQMMNSIDLSTVSHPATP